MSGSCSLKEFEFLGHPARLLTKLKQSCFALYQLYIEPKTKILIIGNPQQMFCHYNQAKIQILAFCRILTLIHPSYLKSLRFYSVGTFFSFFKSKKCSSNVQYSVELVSKELNHFGVIADLFRQIGGHSGRFVLFCSF